MKQNNSQGQLTAQIDLGQPVKSGFKYEYPFKGTGRLGRIYNTRCMKVYPADKLVGKSVAALQFEPLAVPILSNMHVHQEHFYVTLNSLWKNFDKFISGGERLDYNGKMPSMSLQEMFEEFMRLLFTNGGFAPFSEVFRKSSNYKVTLPNSDISSIVNYELETALRDYLDKHQLLDLFEHIQPIYRELGLYLTSIVNSGDPGLYDPSVGIHLFTKAERVTRDDRSNINIVWNEDQPNKYLRKMYKSVIAAYDEANGGNGTIEYLIPTSAGMAYLSYIYEIIKPFFGYSSNLDQMGYNKLTFDNFVYLFVLALIPSIETSWTVGDPVDPYSYLIDNMSTSPQEILSLRAQYVVWYNNYRDQLLEIDAFEPSTEDVIGRLELVALLAPRVRCWHKDTMTTALDSAGTVNAVVPTTNQGTHESLTVKWRDVTGQASEEAIKNDKTVYELRFSAGEVIKIPSGYISGMHDDDQDKVNTTSAYFSLGMLDAVKRGQKWLQKAVYYGNRIQDFLYTHFAVKFLDARLRLPELLGTSHQMVQLTTVINNTNVSGDGVTAIAGDKACVATAYDEHKGEKLNRFCEEHGYIISNLTVMPDVTYANIFNRDLAMLDQFDFPFPEFATLGMDAIYDVELAQKPVRVYTENSQRVSSDPQIFGYQGRYYNAKSHLGEEHGELLDTQDMYTFARDFNIYDSDSMPKLNYKFVHCYPVLDMFVVDNVYSDYFRYDIFHGYDVDRLLPVHSIYM